MLQSWLPLAPAGSGSVRVAPSAVPSPRFHTAMVNSAWSPPLMDGVSVVFATLRPGHWTVTDAWGIRVAWLVAATVATFVNVVQSPSLFEVSLTRCTVAESPGARLPNEQFSVSLPTAPVIEHVPGPP